MRQAACGPSGSHSRPDGGRPEGDPVGAGPRLDGRGGYLTGRGDLAHGRDGPGSPPIPLPRSAAEDGPEAPPRAVPDRPQGRTCPLPPLRGRYGGLSSSPGVGQRPGPGRA